MSSQTLIIFKDILYLPLVFDHPHSKKVFLIFRWAFLHFNLCLKNSLQICPSNFIPFSNLVEEGSGILLAGSSLNGNKNMKRAVVET